MKYYFIIKKQLKKIPNTTELKFNPIRNKFKTYANFLKYVGDYKEYELQKQKNKEKTDLKNRRFTEKDIDSFVKKYAEGISMCQIAKEYDTVINVIKKRLIERNIKIRNYK